VSENLHLSFSDRRLLGCLRGQERWMERVRALRANFGFQRGIELVLFDGTEELSSCLGIHVPDWVTGTYWGNRILLVHPASWINPHIAEFGQILVHELTHIIVTDKTDGLCPMWLNEAFALYYANQIQGMYLDEACFRKEDVYDLCYADDGLYNICASLMTALVEAHGIDAIVRRLTSCISYSDDPVLGREAMKRVMRGLRDSVMRGAIAI